MIKINFGFNDFVSPVHEYDLGHISIEVNEKSVSSRDKQPDQSMMIFIAATDLLDGITEFVHKNKRQFEFVGCDGSFSMLFTRKKKNLVEIKYQNESLGVLDGGELFKAAYSSAVELLKRYEGNIEGSGAAEEGLNASISYASSFT